MKARAWNFVLLALLLAVSGALAWQLDRYADYRKEVASFEYAPVILKPKQGISGDLRLVMKVPERGVLAADFHGVCRREMAL